MRMQVPAAGCCRLRGRIVENEDNRARVNIMKGKGINPSEFGEEDKSLSQSWYTGGEFMGRFVVIVV